MPRRSLAHDDRGLAVGIILFFGMLLIGALLYTLMGEAMADVFSITSASADTQGASDQITLMESIWNRMLFAVLFIAVLFLVARAVREGART